MFINVESSLLLTVFFFFMVIMGTQCDKNQDITLPKHSFAEKVTLTPAQKVYKIGDTIWVGFSTSNKTLLDTISNQRLSSSSLKFYFGATLLPMFQTPPNPADGFCNFVSLSNVVINVRTNESGTTGFFEVACDNAPGYDLQIGIVMKYRGFYLLNLPDWMLLDACNNVTNPYPSASLLFTYNLTDCNKDVYLTIPSSARKENPNGFTEGRIDLKVAYAMQVQ